MNSRRVINPMPPSDWPINTYWTEPPDRVSQHWYITFCLLMSAIQDYLTGMVLARQNNLNWAVTCRYYGLVHAGRMLTFMTVGDFPTQHASLRMLLGTDCTRQIEFNWLSDFPGSQFNKFKVSKIDFLDGLSGLIDDTETFQRCGHGLDALAQLRNKSNYEALLIAHEKYHDRVTHLFERMEKASDSLAKDSIDLAVTAYLAYLRIHSILAEKRQAYTVISNQYVSGRLNPGIREKIGGFQNAVDELARLTRELTVHTDTDTDRLDEIEAHIEMNQFQGKNNLFQFVESKVRELEQVNSGIRRFERGNQR